MEKTGWSMRKWCLPDGVELWSFYKDGLYVVSALDESEFEFILSMFGINRKGGSDEA